MQVAGLLRQIAPDALNAGSKRGGADTGNPAHGGADRRGISRVSSSEWLRVQAGGRLRDISVTSKPDRCFEALSKAAEPRTSV